MRASRASNADARKPRLQRRRAQAATPTPTRARRASDAEVRWWEFRHEPEQFPDFKKNRRRLRCKIIFILSLQS
ncbi:MAG: hypothetical protein FWD19_00790, partial [Defluviitaleaceae bacterium]|nr:hypothetical protein [Defluviitaleaceae bacterium]